MENITVEVLREYLKQECELRNSDFIQKIYDAVNYNRSEEVEDMVQRIIVVKINTRFNLNVDDYRGLLQKHREDLKLDAFFMKHNIMKDCPLKKGKLQRKITDFELFRLENLAGVNLNDLLDRMDGKEKTIVLASSSTWPPVLADIQFFNRFYENFKDQYNIFFVYILQAHSNDWKVGKFSHVDQPKTLADRQTLALKFRDEFKLTVPIYLDDMNNTFNNKFAPWPHRSYVFNNDFGEEHELLYIEHVEAVDYKTITTKLIEFLVDG